MWEGGDELTEGQIRERFDKLTEEQRKDSEERKLGVGGGRWPDRRADVGRRTNRGTDTGRSAADVEGGRWEDGGKPR